MQIKIEELLETYFEMKDGEHIEKFQEEIILLNKSIKIVIRRRALKHVVEQRKKDGYKIFDLQNFFRDLNYILENDEFQIIENSSKEANSYLLLQTVLKKDEGVIVALDLSLIDRNFYFIKTGFYRSVTKIKKLLQKQK
jgi:hypothetical protein